MARAAPQVEAPADLVELGRVVSAYGVRGWLKVQPHSPQADVLLSASRWWLFPPRRGEGAPSPLDVEASRRQGSSIVAGLAGLADRTAAEAWRGAAVCVPRSAFPAAREDEYYWVDLIGCLLYGESDGWPALIGRVAEVLDNGAHALLKVHRLASRAPEAGAQAPQPGDAAGLEPALDAHGRPREVLVPFVAAHVRGVDLGARRIDTSWPADF